MADINALYASLLAADEARDAAALAAVTWQMYGQLATSSHLMHPAACPPAPLRPCLRRRGRRWARPLGQLPVGCLAGPAARGSPPRPRLPGCGVARLRPNRRQGATEGTAAAPLGMAEPLTDR